jgi:hypothetical protein
MQVVLCAKKSVGDVVCLAPADHNRKCLFTLEKRLFLGCDNAIALSETQRLMNKGIVQLYICIIKRELLL